jgi:hypoxanthine phosphoribosyltransferase
VRRDVPSPNPPPPNPFPNHPGLPPEKQVDDSRKTLAACVAMLQGDIDAARSAARAAGTEWEEPDVGIMVLAYKRRPKLAELPAKILQDR